jgi:hypothetical protein
VTFDQSQQAADMCDLGMSEERAEQTRAPDETINFWDRLEEIKFCPELLEEFILRNPSPVGPVVSASWSIDDTEILFKTAYKQLQYFARHGGPDISHLREV